VVQDLKETDREMDKQTDRRTDGQDGDLYRFGCILIRHYCAASAIRPA